MAPETNGFTLENEPGGLEPILKIIADNFGVTTITTLLKTINFCEKVNVLVTMQGLRFVVEEGKYVQGGLFLRSMLFKTYQVNQEAGGFGFKIPFKELLDCLKLLGGEGKVTNNTVTDSSDGTSTSMVSGISRTMEITYCGHGTPCKLSLEEPGMFTELELKTEELDSLIDFDEVEKDWEMILDAKLLHEHLFELEGYLPEHVILRVVPNKCLQFRANGSAGSLKISIPKNCTGVERFGSLTEIQQNYYKFSVLRYSFKLIQVAEKVIMQKGDVGVLSLRLVFKESMGAFGEFFIMPMADVDDDEETLDNDVTM